MFGIKRIFWIVLDSVGIGAEPDAADYGDEGTNTLRSCFESGRLDIPNLRNAGIFNIDEVGTGSSVKAPAGAFGRLREASKGKDTTTGHWEMAGIISEKPLPTFPTGFPDEVISELERRTGRKILCNKPYSGTKVIADYGEEHLRTGALIVYTSADSVFQIAAHESIVPVEELYRYCETARNILTGDLGVGRVIARPFEGEPPFVRTPRRHDFSITPPKKTVLDLIAETGRDVIAVGKINDIFAGKGITEAVRTSCNSDGQNRTLEYADRDFSGLCYVNLVDFDMKYGHRRDVSGYTDALNDFDISLGKLISKLSDDDIVFITADHGCDPLAHGTDHTREYVPMIALGKRIIPGKNIGTRASFSDLGAAVGDILGADISQISGKSFAPMIIDV